MHTVAYPWADAPLTTLCVSQHFMHALAYKFHETTIRMKKDHGVRGRWAVRSAVYNGSAAHPMVMSNRPNATARLLRLIALIADVLSQRLSMRTDGPAI